MRTFCLWSEPWIPVIDIEGTSRELGIQEALTHAHLLREIFDASPLVTVALHRLLLAILYRIFNPQREQEWVELWREGCLDPEKIGQYGNEWAGRFDLLHPQRPFYQVAYMEGEKIHPITALVFEAASGNNPTLFDHGWVEGSDRLRLERGACHLIAHQLFAVGGGVSKPFNRMDGPLTKGLIVMARGRSLFETLLLNLMPLEHWRSHVPSTPEDMPFWELDNFPEPVRQGTVPLGPMHYLTWQTRQVHLCFNEEMTFATGCQIRQRYALPKTGERFDPGKPYQMSKKNGYQPFKLRKERAAWQSLNVLLQKVDADTSRPWLVEWLAEAEQMGRWHELDMPAVVGMSVVGLTTDSRKAAKIDLWRREYLPIPVVLLDDPSLLGDLEELLNLARRVESLLRRTATTLAWAFSMHAELPLALTYFRTGKLPKNMNKNSLGLYERLGASLGMVRAYWPKLEDPFYECLGGLSVGDFDSMRKIWSEAVLAAAKESFDSTRQLVLHTTTSYEELSRIEVAFVRRLHWELSNRDVREEWTVDDEAVEESA